MKRQAILFICVISSLVPAPGQESFSQGTLESMVEAERAFAAAGLAEGIRASFMKFFSDSAIAFSPAPFRFKDVVGKLPPPADPHARSLLWEPIAGDIAASGDLGYLMGPSKMSTNTAQHPPSYGFYLSVWRHQGNGTWKVDLDVGTEAKESIMSYFGTPFQALGKMDSVAPPDPEPFARDHAVLFRLDSVLSERQEIHGVPAAYEAVLDRDARVLRDNFGVMQGKEAILSHFDTLGSARFLSPMGGSLSQAGDLGYTYGAYRSSVTTTSPSGYYVHIWKRSSRSPWRLVVDKESPAENP